MPHKVLGLMDPTKKLKIKLSLSLFNSSKAHLFALNDYSLMSFLGLLFFVCLILKDQKNNNFGLENMLLHLTNLPLAHLCPMLVLGPELELA